VQGRTAHRQSATERLNDIGRLDAVGASIAVQARPARRQSAAGGAHRKPMIATAAGRRAPGAATASSGSTRPRHQSRIAVQVRAGAPRKPAGALSRAGLWLFPARRAEDATPESATFGDQAPRAAAAWRDSRPDSADPATPAYGGGRPGGAASWQGEAAVGGTTAWESPCP